MAHQDGLEWVQTKFQTEPRWTKTPDIEIIRKLASPYITDGTRCNVEFLAQGAFNKLYKVGFEGNVLLMRVSLPVDPHFKTASEVATLDFLHRITIRDMPVPKIIAYDASNNNELGFEWILMEMMRGDTLRKRWRKMTFDFKTTLVKQLAFSQARLFGYQFKEIGNLYHATSAEGKSSAAQRSFTVKRIVSTAFFRTDHVADDNTSRGPFLSSAAWLEARLRLTINHQDGVMRSSEDEDDIENAELARSNAQRLIELLPYVFPQRDEQYQETAMLLHDDLSFMNIMVDEQGRLTAVVDWECVSVLPLFRACQFPAFLISNERDEEPHRSEYGPPWEHDGDDESLDNEDMNDIYWEHCMEYEQTKLRSVFLDEMKRVEPRWVDVMAQSVIQADFELAVQCCDGDLSLDIVRTWLDSLESGSICKGLMSVFHNWRGTSYSLRKQGISR